MWHNYTTLWLQDTHCLMLSRKRKLSEYSVSSPGEASAKRVRFTPMVGVPRSKGCRMCVQRRVKCDQTRPFCNRCVKGKKECPGYEPRIKFQDEGPKLRELYRHDTSEQISGQTSTQASSEDPQFEYSTDVPLTLRLTHATKLAASDAADEAPVFPSSFETKLLIAIMSPTLDQAQLLSAFIDTLSVNNTLTILPTLHSTSFFLTSVAHHADQSLTLSCAVRAVSLSHLGRQVSDQKVIQLSRQTYRQALLTLNAALQDPIDGLSAPTLAATILLSWYEIINCTERDSWVRHAGGAGHLMRLRGPSKHLTGLGRAAFLAYRHSLVIEAFISGSTTFLAAQPWLDLSRSIQDSQPPADRSCINDTVSEFHLLTVEIPGFVQSVTDADASPVTKKTLLTSGLAHHKNLHVWYDHILATLEETDQQITTDPSIIPDAHFPQSYAFPSLAVGSLLCGYWAVLTILNRNVALLQNELALRDVPISEPGTSPSSHYRLRDASVDRTTGFSNGGENLKNARSICMAVEGLSSPAFLGPLYLIFALRVAFQTFDTVGKSEEGEWVIGRLQKIGRYLGIARRLLDDDEEEGEDVEGGSRSVSASQSVSQSVSRSATGSPDLSRRHSLQQQQVLSREVSREGSGMGVSLQEIELGRVSSSESWREDRSSTSKGKGRDP